MVHPSLRFATGPSESAMHQAEIRSFVLYSLTASEVSAMHQAKIRSFVSYSLTAPR